MKGYIYCRHLISIYLYLLIFVQLHVFKFQIVMTVIILWERVVHFHRGLLRLVTSMYAHAERTSHIVIPFGIIWVMNVAKNHSSTAYTALLSIHGGLHYRDIFLQNIIKLCMGNEMQVDNSYIPKILYTDVRSLVR